MSTLTATPIDVALAIVVGYLAGSIPLANVIAGNVDSIDLRETGDRNPGFWNARDALGDRAAAWVFIGDVSKGVTAALVGSALADDGVWGVAVVATGAAMVGHAFPLFAGFRGGRSVLTFVGGVAVIAPQSVSWSMLVLLVAFAVGGSFAIAARVGIAALPCIALFVDGPHRTAAIGALMTFIGLRFATAVLATRRREPSQE